MLAREWYVLAVLWAMLMVGIASTGGDWAAPAFWVLSLGPLAVPTLLRWFICFVVFGNVRAGSEDGPTASPRNRQERLHE